MDDEDLTLELAGADDERRHALLVALGGPVTARLGERAYRMVAVTKEADRITLTLRAVPA